MGGKRRRERIDVHILGAYKVERGCNDYKTSLQSFPMRRGGCRIF